MLQRPAGGSRPKASGVQGCRPARRYLVHGVADAQQALPAPPPPPAVLLHQTQQHGAAGLRRAFLPMGIHLTQTDFELGIGPVSGWKSPGDGGSPTGSEETGKTKREGRTSVTPRKASFWPNSAWEPASASCLSKTVRPFLLTP